MVPVSLCLITASCRYQYDLNALAATSQLRLTSTRDLNLNVSVSNANMIIQAYASWNNLSHAHECYKNIVKFLQPFSFLLTSLLFFRCILHSPFYITCFLLPGCIFSNLWWKLYHWHTPQEKLLYNPSKQTWSGYFYSCYWSSGSPKYNSDAIWGYEGCESSCVEKYARISFEG